MVLVRKFLIGNIKVKRLKIGVRSIFKPSIEGFSVQKKIIGFTLDVFEAAVKLLPYKLSFEIVPFYSDEDDLLKKVALKEKHPKVLTQFVLAPWLLLMLVLTSTFTASLTTMMINSNSKPSRIEINMLKLENAAVGCDGSSFVIRYLVRVLGFKPNNIRNIATIHDTAEALSSGKIKAAFFLKPYATAFLARYFADFAIVEPTYELGGFGFAFQKGSDLASDMSQAFLKLKGKWGIAANRGKNALLFQLLSFRF
ncbi:hypothetical protein GH714_032271 [Hevea brasiliensis]|uniref:Ionotropic glutamate receptor C-terminal domain-containing protein n=1 Tax=Hevea brasiliensis TaxID=3981 RepID=A0A6A6L1I3_HEVBR|nr:hypothetical protein GH714_032271 [Hevea brasiliensis]